MNSCATFARVGRAIHGESYTYDSNGNRTNAGYVTGDHNRLLSDGTYTYEYDGEGNRTKRINVATGEVTEYTWDHRNRLVSVIDRAAPDGPALQTVQYVYDTQNRWIAKTLDPDGDRGQKPTTTHFVYDLVPPLPPGEGQGEGWASVGQIVLALDSDGSVTNRYLWGPNIDQILADEQLPSPSGRGAGGEGGNGRANAHGHNHPGEVLWPLTDHLNTVRDLAQYNPETGETTVVNHLTYDAFGRILTQTDPAVTTFFAFTGRPFDADTALQNNLNRWYEASMGRWLSEDPIGFGGRDANLYRYVENTPTNATDPSGTNLPPKVLKALEELAKKKNWTPEQLAAAKQWVEDALEAARSTRIPDKFDNCWKWANAVVGKIPAPPEGLAGLSAKVVPWYYPRIWNPINGYLTHATVMITIGDEVFYVDNGWWGGEPGVVFGPEKVSPNVEPYNYLSPPGPPVWWEMWKMMPRGYTFFPPW